MDVWQWQWRRLAGKDCPGWARVLRDASLYGAVLVALVPAARGQHAWLGWWPLWLVGMPLMAWWGAAGMPVPAGGRVSAAVACQPPRRRQARRRSRPDGGRPMGVTVGRGRPARGCASVRSQ